MTQTRERVKRQGTTRPIEIGTRVDGYRVERIVTRREGLHTLAEAASLGGERILLVVAETRLHDDRELRRRLARLLPRRARLRHPHVLTMLRAVDGGQRLHLAALQPGATDLAVRLAGDPLSGEDAMAVLGPVASALDAGRAAGLVHRALAPRSILLDGNGARPLLTDFGLVAPRRPACEQATTIEDAAYRAPEEIHGQTAEGATNVYSLACILFEALTGAPPFAGARPLLTLHAHLTAEPPRASTRNPNLPAGLDTVFSKALSKDPRVRHASAVALVDEAAVALGLATPVPVNRPVRRPARRPAPEPAAPKRAGHERKPARRARSRGRARALLLAGVALAASAGAGFTSGNSLLGGGDKGASPGAEVASAGPVGVRPSNTPRVSRTVARLESRRVAARRRLRGADGPRAQATAATALADAYSDAGERVGDESLLAGHVAAVEKAYRRLAAAARHEDAGAWRSARSAALENEESLELLLRTRGWD